MSSETPKVLGLSVRTYSLEWRCVCGCDNEEPIADRDTGPDAMTFDFDTFCDMCEREARIIVPIAYRYCASIEGARIEVTD